MNRNYRKLALIGLVALALLVCWSVAPAEDEKGPAAKTATPKASAPADEFEAEFAEDNFSSIADPLKPWNQACFHFNDKLYFWALKPVAQGWDYIAPDAVERRINDFLVNMAFPARFLNTLLQARPHHSAVELTRFLTNLTVGVLGFWDPATKWFELKRYDEDFDQTLGCWRVGMGVYVTWPLFGPSSLRGTLALPIDIYTKHPLPGSSVIDQINKTAMGENPYESLRELAVDPYVSIRDAYVQNRRKAILDRGED